MATRSELEMKIDRLKDEVRSAESEKAKANPLLALLLILVTGILGFGLPFLWLGTLAGGVMLMLALGKGSTAASKLSNAKNSLELARKEYAALDD